jgi:hypothetical protein
MAQVNYLSRDFQSLKKDLINWARTYHPEALAYFNDNTPDILYAEMVAYVGDVLNFYIDKTFNESFLSTAQARESLFRIANDLGFFNLGTTPAQTQVVLTITVPPYLDTQTGQLIPDPDLLIAIRPGMLLNSDSGVPFEVLEEINFADPINRTIIRNLDGNGQLIDYTIQKTAVAKAGQTKIQRFYVSDALAKPFMTITLQDDDVTEITGVVSVPGNQYIAPPEEDFTDPDKAYIEVSYLAKEKMFVEINPTQPSSSNFTSFIPNTIKTGAYVDIPRRFIARRDVNNLVTLTFGNNSTSYSAFNSLIQTTIDPTQINYNQVLNNTTLGEIPPPDTTLFIRYRVGGGDNTNVIANQINSIAAKTFFPAPASTRPNFLTLLQQVRNSLTVTNHLPAVGGRSTPGNEEIRVTAGKIFAAGDRGVTYEDIVALISQMPAKFGKPFRIAYEEIKPRVANMSQVSLGVNYYLEQLLNQDTSLGRQKIAQEIKTFLNNLENGISTVIPPSGQTSTSTTVMSAESVSLLGSLPTLWIGEKARLYVLSLNENGQIVGAIKDPTTQLFLSPQQLLKENIKEFLKDKRVIGDWIDVVDGRVIDIQIEFTLLVDKKNKQQVLIEALNKMRNYFNVDNWQMNQPIYVSNVSTILQEINGVINVVDLKFYNIFGLGNNSIDPISGREYTPGEIGRYRRIITPSVSSANNKFEMKAVNNIIEQWPDSIFHVRYPNIDIVGKVL